jgi:membrane-associated phospholipid phosphatase
MARAIALVAAALAVFTGIVIAGWLTRIDDWAIDHVMPGLDPHSNVSIVNGTGLWRPFPLPAPWWEKVLDVYLYPASLLVSAVVTAACCAVLARRGYVVPALVWLAAWLGANAVELAGKLGLDRPDVRWSNGTPSVHVVSFDHSYPSGHTARGVVLAALLAYAFPRVRIVAAVWLLLVPVALVAAGDHTVSDVVGGLLLGLLLVLGAHAMMREWIPWRTSWRSSSGASSATRTRSSPTWRAARSSSRTAS